MSLISSSIEYVLAESTRTMSLQYDSVEDPKDKACLGTCSLLRDEGLNALALDGWRKAHHLREPPTDHHFYYTEGVSPHWHIISDVRCHEQYAQRSFVKRNPGIRFYASIPLRGALGSVLGSLAIADDAPRYGLSAAEMTFMEDIADTITQHLYATVVQSQRQRSERLIQSLGLFNSGKSSLRHWWLKQEDSRVSNLGRHKVQNLTSGQRRTAANKEFGFRDSSSSEKLSDKDRLTFSQDASETDTSGQGEMPSSTTSLQNASAHIARDQGHVTSYDFAKGHSGDRSKVPHSQDTNSASTEVEQLPSPKQSLRPNAARLKSGSKPASNEDFDLATASQRTYARASNLIREALGADGVVFINADMATPETGNGTSTPSLGRKGSNSSGRFSHSDNDTSDSASGSQSCSIHAFSTMEKSSIHSGDRSYHFDVSEKFLALLIRRYPQGRVFNFSQDGSSCTTSGEDSMTSGSNSESQANKSKQRMSRDGMRLGETMEGARTIAFYPIWDEANGCWSSGLFVWSTSPLRYFDEAEDITYLASWSHSVLAELGRLQIVADDRAKGSFISSVSHELRSPLHGTYIMTSVGSPWMHHCLSLWL